jgi:sulfate adenylyltransferase (ADP) / ATP adenylyltransferase
LVLNKFAVVPAHFILATREFKSQTALLDEADLEAAWGCLKAWKTAAATAAVEGGGELFAFFNSGPFSGASQAHRHLQLLPVEMMREGLQNVEGQRRDWGVLADRLVEEPELPFMYFAKRLPCEPTPGQLHHLYIELYDKACSLVREYAMKHPYEDQLLSDDQNGESAISYNLGLTDKVMVLCPRRAEGSFISDRDTETANIGPVSLNGTVLAGTLLVKNEAEWNGLRNDMSQLTKVLGAIGIPLPSIADKRL